jgi:two-component system, LuxR family, response regulator FixJ
VTNEYGRRKMMGVDGLMQVKAEGQAAATARAHVLETSRTGDDWKCPPDALVAIVDDDQYASAGLRALIESQGYRVATFASAEEYLASDLRKSAAFLIVDVNLAGMSGPDLQANLIAEGSFPPTVFVTGRLEEHVRNRVTEAGAIGYLSKSCKKDALLSLLGKVLRTTA